MVQKGKGLPPTEVMYDCSELNLSLTRCGEQHQGRERGPEGEMFALGSVKTRRLAWEMLSLAFGLCPLLKQS